MDLNLKKKKSNSINKLVVCNFTHTEDFSFHEALIERVK